MGKESKIRGLYIPTNGKRNADEPSQEARYIVRTMKELKSLVAGNKDSKCMKDYLDNELRIFYDNNLSEPINEYINRYVKNSNIHGPVIVIKKNGDLDLNTHKSLGINVLRHIDSIGFNLVF